MRQHTFIDCVEVRPGVWASREDADKVNAAQITLPDLGKGRAQTIDDIPDAGSPLVFWVMLAVVVLIALLR